MPGAGELFAHEFPLKPVEIAKTVKSIRNYGESGYDPKVTLVAGGF